MPIQIKTQQREWSPYQKAIFQDVASGSGHTIVIARAGSGKTSSIVEAFRYVPKKAKTLMVAFNKSIADELRERAPSYIDCFTLHSLGFRAVRMAFGSSVSLDTDKTFKIVRNILFKDDKEVLEKEGYARIFILCRAISLCKGYLIDTPSKIDDLLDDFGIDPGEENREEFIKTIIKALRICKETRQTIDFDDMVWFPFVYNIPIGKWDVVFIDEAQDLNAAQIFMALSACKKQGRILAVGDPAQSIYRFRGADSEAIDNIKKKLNAKTLPLPISYRCGKTIIDRAKEIVPDIEAAPGAIDGYIDTIGEDKLLKHVKPGDFVLSRTNAPLIKYCLQLLKVGISANIQGKDIGISLSMLIKQSKKKTVKDFLKWLDNWRDSEIERLSKKNRDASIIMDKAECLENLCEGVESLSEVQDNIDNLFKDVDDSSKVVFSTTHKAKGLERNRVFMLTWTYKKGKDQEEDNIWYVAVTRAKRELFLVQKIGK